MVKRPLVQVVQEGRNSRSTYNPLDWDGPEKARVRLAEQIQAVLADPDQVDNPISQSLDLKALRETGGEVGEFVAGLVEAVSDLSAQVRALSSDPRLFVLRRSTASSPWNSQAIQIWTLGNSIVPGGASANRFMFQGEEARLPTDGLPPLGGRGPATAKRVERRDQAVRGAAPGSRGRVGPGVPGVAGERGPVRYGRRLTGQFGRGSGGSPDRNCKRRLGRASEGDGR